MPRQDMWEIAAKTLSGQLRTLRIGATRQAIERWLRDTGAIKFTFTPLTDAPAVYTVHVYNSDNEIALTYTAGVTKDITAWLDAAQEKLAVAA